MEREDPDNPNPSKWHAIAKHVPNRTNKDCRKRWFAKMASDVVKGGWAPDEDEKLVKGIERYGTRWSLVASMVQTRNSDQCAKRWTDTLNPAIDRTTWTADADELLLQAVNEHGKVWTKIVKTYFPGRTGLSAKNRYNSITRFNNDHSRSARPRRKTPDLLPYLSHHKSESVSSSSSSVSPSTPSISIPDPSFSAIDSVPESYFFESLAGWHQSSSPSEAMDELVSFYSSSGTFDMKDHVLSNADSCHQPFDAAINQALSFSNDANSLYSPSHNATSDNFFPKELQTQQQLNDSSNLYSMPSIEHYPPFPQYSGITNNDIASQLALLDASHMGVNWESSVPAFGASHGSKVNNNSYVF